LLRSFRHRSVLSLSPPSFPTRRSSDLSYSVGQRVREFGIRMALGAQRRGLALFVLRHAGLLTISGAMIGLAGSWMLMRLISALLDRKSTRLNPVTSGSRMPSSA